MVAYTFKARFADAIRSGAKRQTIRRVGKRKPPKPGDLVSLFTGMRTNNCIRLGVSRCISARPILINFDTSTIMIHTDLLGWTQLVPPTPEGLDQFARADGLDSWDDFRALFGQMHGLGPFEGVMISWGDLV